MIYSFFFSFSRTHTTCSNMRMTNDEEEKKTNNRTSRLLFHRSCLSVFCSRNQQTQTKKKNTHTHCNNIEWEIHWDRLCMAYVRSVRFRLVGYLTLFMFLLLWPFGLDDEEKRWIITSLNGIWIWCILVSIAFTVDSTVHRSLHTQMHTVVCQSNFTQLADISV